MLKVNLKKIISIILLGAMIIGASPISSMATTVDENNYEYQESMIQPRLTYIVEAANGFGINNNIAEVDCWVTGHYLDATKAKVIAELQVKSGNNWIPVKIWTDTQNDYRASIYEEYDVDAGKTYRVKATYYIWEGSQSESLIIISDEKP